MYNEQYYYYDQSDAKFGGLFDEVLQGVNVGLKSLPFLQQLVGGSSSTPTQCGSGQAKGLANIQRCSAQVLQALDALNSQVGQVPYQQLVDKANQLVNMLSDTTYFYQPKKGDDKNALDSAKASANQKLQTLISAVNVQSGSPIDAGVNASGQVITNTGNVLSNPVVLYGGLAVLALLLIKR